MGLPADRLPADFPSYLEGLSLRASKTEAGTPLKTQFPFLLGRAFIEASSFLMSSGARSVRVSLLFRKGFH